MNTGSPSIAAELLVWERAAAFTTEEEVARRYDEALAERDAELGIDWPFPATELLLSGRDADLPPLAEARLNFEYAG